MIRLIGNGLIPRLSVLAGVVMLSAGMALAQVNSSAPTPAGQRTDGQIEMDVVHALDGSSALKNDLITAATIQGEVTLSGTVSSQTSKDLAESIVHGVPGVTKVHNNLTVGDPQKAAEDQNLSQQDQNDDMAVSQPQTSAQNQPLTEPDNSQANTASSPYPQQPQYPAPYPQARPQYSPYPAPPPQYGQQQPYGYPQQPTYAPAQGPVTIAQGALLQVRTSEPVDSKRAVNGAPVQFTVIQDVTAGGVLAIPRGATIHGVITEVKQTHQGDLGGKSELALMLTSLDLGGQTYPLQADEFRVQGPSKAGETAGNMIAGGLLGTIIGCAAGRGVGCAVGAGAGLAAGTAASAAEKGPAAWIPAEARVDFHLAAPLTVNPVSAQEAARLAQGLYPGGPTLYRRGGPAPYYYGPYGYPAYAYPPVYYRPYYMMGGLYYWR